MKYDRLDKEDFDAIVTGELTHYAIWMESEINRLITDYFVAEKTKSDEFRRWILHRDGLTFQDKLEIARGMTSSFGLNEEDQKLFRTILTGIENFKSWRNAMAHGFDNTPGDYQGAIRIEIVSRSGKEKTIEITPESHEAKLDEAEKLYHSLKNIVSTALGTRSDASQCSR
jgi:hypothetical protein